MDNNVFRTPVQNEAPLPIKEGKGESTHVSNTDVPYTDYENVHNHPYLVDHFKLGDTWQDKLGGFEKEIKTIDSYFKEKIESGVLKNDKEAVKEKIKEIYKFCKIDNTERTTMQIEKLAAYIEFLKKTDNINLNHKRYGF